MINRPSRYSATGRLTSCTPLLARQLCWPRDHRPPKVIYLHGRLSQLPDLSGLWAADLDSGQRGRACRLGPGPSTYVCRPGCPDPRYDQVLVAGQRAWRKSRSRRGDKIVAASVSAARALGLDFCLVMWRFVGEAARRPTLVSIDPWPPADQVGDLLAPATRALQQVLT